MIRRLNALRFRNLARERSQLLAELDDLAEAFRLTEEEARAWYLWRIAKLDRQIADLGYRQVKP